MKRSKRGSAREVAVSMLALAALTGCGSRSTEVPVGCSRDAEVPAAVGDELTRAARAFYAHAEKGEWKAVYEGAARALREKQTEAQLTGPLSRVFQELGPVPRLEPVGMAVVRFGEGFPHRSQVECPGKGDALPLTLLLDDHPVQASVVGRGTLRGDSFYLSTLWHQEEGGWRLAAFFVKPATLLGRTSAQFEADAGAEREAGNARNAALLYNVAIDLSVPNAWTRPGEVDALQRKQRRLSVTQLPVGKTEDWPAPPDTFRVNAVAYTVLPSGLGVLVRWEPGQSLADTTALVPAAERLHEYVVSSFPEYSRVFRGLVLEASDPTEPARTWSRIYRLESGR